MKKQLVFIAASLFSAVAGFSQTYWREAVDPVSASGYYNIELSQEIVGLGLRTLRLRDAGNNEVPYLIRSSVPVKEMKRMESYKLMSSTKRDSTNVIVIFTGGIPASRFYLLMTEAGADKHISIRGSYDGEWFGVKQRSPLSSEHNPDMGGVAIVDFPQSDYTYYELTITNSSGSPLNIKGVGKIENSTIYGRFVELASGAFEATELDGNTVITFPAMEYPCYLSKLELTAEGKGHYSRRIYIEGNGCERACFQLSSRDEPVFYPENLLVDKDIRLIVENAGNPPLTIRGVKLFGLGRYLCAWLEEGAAYRIETAADQTPPYDIQDFSAEIPLNLPVAKTGKLEKIVIEEPEREVKFYETPAFMWSVIALTGIILLLVCARMLKELKKRKE